MNPVERRLGGTLARHGFALDRAANLGDLVVLFDLLFDGLQLLGLRRVFFDLVPEAIGRYREQDGGDQHAEGDGKAAVHRPAPRCAMRLRRRFFALIA